MLAFSLAMMSNHFAPCDGIADALGAAPEGTLRGIRLNCAADATHPHRRLRSFPSTMTPRLPAPSAGLAAAISAAHECASRGIRFSCAPDAAHPHSGMVACPLSITSRIFRPSAGIVTALGAAHECTLPGIRVKGAAKVATAFPRTPNHQKRAQQAVLGKGQRGTGGAPVIILRGTLGTALCIATVAHVARRPRRGPSRPFCAADAAQPPPSCASKMLAADNGAVSGGIERIHKETKALLRNVVHLAVILWFGRLRRPPGRDTRHPTAGSAGGDGGAGIQPRGFMLRSSLRCHHIPLVNTLRASLELAPLPLSSPPLALSFDRRSFLLRSSYSRTR